MIETYKDFEEFLNSLEYRPKLLLHSCCGPCSSAVIERLKEEYDITILYYNPCIYPFEEYEKRKAEQIRLLNILGVNILDCEYDNDKYENLIKGQENEREGGSRCSICFRQRLQKTAEVAKQNNFDIFCTTLTVSPHKNAKLINEIGSEIANQVGISYLPSDFKKQDGYKRSLELSKKYELYRQNYCGCRYSIR